MQPIQKIQVIVAGLAAFIFIVLSSGAATSASTAILQSLEALSFLLSATAIYSSAKALRAQYETLGSNKDAARRSSGYMKMRRTVRWWSYFAVLAMVGVGAHRFNIQPWLALGLFAVALPPVMLVVDQSTGWRGQSEQ